MAHNFIILFYSFFFSLYGVYFFRSSLSLIYWSFFGFLFFLLSACFISRFSAFFSCFCQLLLSLVFRVSFLLSAYFISRFSAFSSFFCKLVLLVVLRLSFLSSVSLCYPSFIGFLFYSFVCMFYQSLFGFRFVLLSVCFISPFSASFSFYC